MRQIGGTVFFATAATTCIAIMSDIVLSFAKKDIPWIWSTCIIIGLYLFFFWLFVPEKGNVE